VVHCLLGKDAVDDILPAHGRVGEVGPVGEAYIDDVDAALLEEAHGTAVRVAHEVALLDVHVDVEEDVLACGVVQVGRETYAPPVQLEDAEGVDDGIDSSMGPMTVPVVEQGTDALDADRPDSNSAFLEEDVDLCEACVGQQGNANEGADDHDIEKHGVEEDLEAVAARGGGVAYFLAHRWEIDGGNHSVVVAVDDETEVLSYHYNYCFVSLLASSCFRPENWSVFHCPW